MKLNYYLPGILCLSSLFVIGCKEVFVTDLGKKNVTLLAPANKVISNDPSQSFYWQPLDSGINYELELSVGTPDSIVQLFVDTTVRSNVLQLTLPPAQYQWRVRAFNSASSTPFSAFWQLTITN